MIIWTVNSLIALHSLLVLYNSEIDHFNDVVTLERKGCEVTYRPIVILEFNYKLIVFETFNNFFDHRDVIWFAFVVFKSIVQYILNEIKLNHSTVTDLISTILSILLHREEQEWINMSIFNCSTCVHVLACPRSKSDCFKIAFTRSLLTQCLICLNNILKVLHKL